MFKLWTNLVDPPTHVPPPPTIEEPTTTVGIDVLRRNLAVAESTARRLQAIIDELFTTIHDQRSYIKKLLRERKDLEDLLPRKE